MASNVTTSKDLLDLSLDSESYVALLAKLIGVSEKLQNSPPSLIPEEDQAGKIVLEALKPYSTENGGPLIVEHKSYVEGRGNVIITYPGTSAGSKTCTLIGSHLDLVPADPETWDWNPFELTRDGDKLYGRGTTDCLGHVAVVTELFIAMAKLKPVLETSISAVFIASEESTSIPDVGVDGLMANGELERFKNGPMLWVDCSDSQPCIGTAGAMQWHLKASGKLFHSGLPHLGINSIELGMEALKIVQDRFYEDFPPHKMEAEYNYATPSTMKPTQVECAKGSLNQICPHTTISGDIRLTPFYEVKDVEAKVNGYIADLNAGMDSSIPFRGPASKYVLPDGTKGKIEFTWAELAMEGIACNLKSNGYKAICKALKAIKGDATPFAVSGSLPLVRDLQRAGMDLQLIGFGLSAAYHANNEYCLLSEMENGFKVLARFIHHIEANDVE